MTKWLVIHRSPHPSSGEDRIYYFVFDSESVARKYSESIGSWDGNYVIEEVTYYPTCI